MTVKKIIDKALKKAADNGFSADNAWRWSIVAGDGDSLRRFAPILIFDHHFAKALWGEDWLWRSDIDKPYRKAINKNLGHEGGNYRVAEHAWQYHLRMMVIAEDPIKYLGENL